MALITLEGDVSYLQINYPDEIISIRYSLTKQLTYNQDTGATLIIESRGVTHELNYQDIEDPNNPGYPFAAGSILFAFVASLYGFTYAEVVSYQTSDGDTPYHVIEGSIEVLKY